MNDEDKIFIWAGLAVVSGLIVGCYISTLSPDSMIKVTLAGVGLLIPISAFLGKP
jgi:hypothetical protein